MRIEVGCNLREFKECYERLASDNEWRGTFGFSEELGTRWERALVAKPELLRVWRENGEIIGHAICMKTALMNMEKEMNLIKRIKRLCEYAVGGRKRTLVSFTKSSYGRRIGRRGIVSGSSISLNDSSGRKAAVQSYTMQIIRQLEPSAETGVRKKATLKQRTGSSSA